MRLREFLEFTKTLPEEAGEWELTIPIKISDDEHNKKMELIGKTVAACFTAGNAIFLLNDYNNEQFKKIRFKTNGESND